MMLKMLTRNLPIKVTSLALATFLWLIVAGQREVVRQVQVPVVLPDVPANLMYIIPPPETVTITFNASARRLLWFRLQPPRMAPQIALTETDEPLSIALRQELLDLPRQFTGAVLDIQPRDIEIHLAEVMEIEVPVFVVVGREPRHPYRLMNPDLPTEPSTVTARGPRAQVEHRNYVRTKPINLADKTTNGELEVELEVPGSLITFDPGKVRVRYEIREWQNE
ncbi:MAG: YbbR-like domain-containing protein [bacterium]|nr:YbbR-like domain-containing protein [bacterium]